MYRIVLTIHAPTEGRAKEFAEELEAIAFEHWCEGNQQIGLLSRIESLPNPTSPVQEKT
jgi:hypothetical protein